MLSALDTVRIYSRNLAKMQAATAADPMVKRETAYFQSKIGTVKTSKDFVGNYRLFSYAMRAFGLSDMTYAKSFMQKALDGGLADSRSMANTLTDPRFKAFVTALDFGDLGASATSFAANNTAVSSKYIQQTLEDNAGQQNEGAQLALYFQRQAPTITGGGQILANKALFQFVQTAYNIPTFSGTTAAAVKSEIALVEKRINIADLKNPAKVQNMVTRFATLWDASNIDAAATSPALAVLTGSPQSEADSILSSAARKYSQY